MGLVLGGLFVCCGVVGAQVFTATSGTDSTDTVAALTASDLTRLGASDDKRMQSNVGWPNAGHYDETKYLEFKFNLGEGTVTNVAIINEYRRNSTLAGAKLIVIAQGKEKNYVLTVPEDDGVDVKDVINLSGDFPALTGAITVRFSAFREYVKGGSTTTSHDHIALEGEFSGPTTPTLIPTPSLILTATPTPTPLPTTLTPSPTPLVIQTVLPTATVTTNVELTVATLSPTAVMPNPTSQSQP